MATILPHQDGTNFLRYLQRNGLSEDQYWAKTLLEMIKLEREAFVFTKLAKKITIPRKAGTKTWTARRYLHLPVDLEKGRLAEGIAPEPMRVEGRTVSATINQYGAYIALTDVAQDVHFDDIFSIYQPELARHAAETVERDLISAIDAEASERFAGGKANSAAITAADVATFRDFRKAWLHMTNQRRKGHPSAGGKPVIVAHPNVMQDLLDDEDLVELVIKPGHGQSLIKEGSVEQYIIYNMYFMETPIIEAVKNASNINVYPTYIIGADAFATLNLGGADIQWFKKGFSADSGDPLGQKSTLGYKLWTGSKVLDTFAVTILHSASAFDSEYEDFSDDLMAQPASQGPAGTTLQMIVGPNKKSYDVSEDGAGGFDPTGLILGYTDNYGNIVAIDNSEVTFGNLVNAATSVTAAYTYNLGDGSPVVNMTGTVTGLTIVA